MKRQRGFTLTELAVAGAIALVLAALALPGFSGMLDAIRLRTTTDELFAAVRHARAQAIARNARVLLAPLSADDDWSQGWAVFIDADDDRRPGGADEILLRRPGNIGRVAIDAVFSTQPSPTYLAYNGAGRACAATSSMVARFGSFTLRQGEAVRRIRINMAGRARVCNPAVDDSCGGEGESP